MVYCFDTRISFYIFSEVKSENNNFHSSGLYLFLFRVLRFCNFVALPVSENDAGTSVFSRLYRFGVAGLGEVKNEKSYR